MASRSGADREPGGLAPTTDDLATAYAAGGDEMAGHAKAEAVLWDGDEGTVLCTVSGRGGRERTVLLRFAADGTEVWRRAYDDGHGAGRAIAPLPGGGYAVAGEVQVGLLDFEACLLRLDAEGEVVERRALGEGGLRTVAVLADGSTLAGGGRHGHGWLVVDGSDRALRDVAEVVSAAASGDGFVLAGVREPSTTALGATRVAAYGPDGGERWARELPAAGRAEPGAVAAAGEGDTVLVGHREPTGDAAAELWIVRLDAAGEQVWERSLGAAGEPRRGRAVATRPGGDLAIAGDAASGGRRRLLAACVRGDGEIAWEREFGHGDEIARDLAATPDGLVLAGFATPPGAARTQALVRRLGGDGDERWLRTFDL
jgi:serine-aspartate repeat-containing protein C/D/E